MPAMMPALRPAAPRPTGVKVACLSAFATCMGITLVALMASRPRLAGEAARQIVHGRGKSPVRWGRPQRASRPQLLLPEFRDAPNCTGDVLQGRVANFDEVSRAGRQRAALEGALGTANRLPYPGVIITSRWDDAVICSRATTASVLIYLDLIEGPF